MLEQELPPIPFSPPRIDEETIAEVVAALRSGWITTGPRVREFEKLLTEYSGHEQTLCLSSCTVGLELALRWFGVGPGDEVIVPAYTYAATANAVEHCGAKPIMVDILPDFSIDPKQIVQSLTSKTKVVMPVDIGGWPCDYDHINRVIQEFVDATGFEARSHEQELLGRPLILADAAHSLGAWYKERRTGSLADISVFSFHAVKNLTTAEGGAVCLNLPAPFSNEDVYDVLRVKALHGQSKDALAKSIAGSWKYDIVEAGYKMNMTDIQAAMGLVEIRRYDSDMLPRRKEIFDGYTAALKEYEWAMVPDYETAERTSSYHVYMLRINGAEESQRDAIINYMAGKGVAANVHFIPLPMMSYYASKGYKMSDYPRALENYSNEISLPVYYSLSESNRARVIATLIEAVENVMK